MSTMPSAERSDKGAHIGHTGPVICCTYSPDGHKFVSGSSDKTLRLWGAPDGHPLSAFAGHTDWVTCCAFSPDCKSIVSGSYDKSVRLWRVRDGRSFATVCGASGHSDSVNCCAYSASGTLVATGSCDKTLRLWRPEKGCLIPVAILADHTDWIMCCAFSPDSRFVMSGSKDKTIRMWRTDTLAPACTLAGHAKTVTCCAFSPRGNLVVSGSEDATLRLWSPDGRCAATLAGHGGAVWCCAFAPSGDTVLSGSSDNTLRLWSVRTGQAIATLNGHTGTVWCCAFSPDGDTVLSGSNDKTLRLWSLSIAKSPSPSPGHTPPIAAFCAPADPRPSKQPQPPLQLLQPPLQPQRQQQQPPPPMQPQPQCGGMLACTALRKAYEKAAAVLQEAQALTGRAAAERQRAAGVTLAAQGALDAARGRVAEIERALEEARRAAMVCEGEVRAAALRQHEAEVYESSVVVATAKAAEAAQDARDEYERARAREKDLLAVLDTRRVSNLSERDVADALSELGLGAYTEAFALNHVSGAVLNDLGDADLRNLGLDSFADRKRLVHALHVVRACGMLRVSRAVIEELAAASGTGSEKVLSAAWSPVDVCRWLTWVGVPADAVAKFAAAGVTGEQLLHVDDADMAELGVASPADRKRLAKGIATLREAHFGALEARFCKPAAALRAPVVRKEQQQQQPRKPPPESKDEPVVLPRDFVCPITLQIMEDPVVAPDGFTYEREAISKWLAGHCTSPMTGAPMEREPLVNNATMRSAIASFMDDNAGRRVVY
eukprot:m51a1_g3116 putative wd40 repeat-containing protein (775) ;mRNA; f:170913-174845